MAHQYSPTPESYELEIGRIKLLVRDSLIERTEGGVVILNGNKQMIAGSGTAEAIFSRLGTQALKEIESMRAQLGPQNAATVRMTSGLPQWNYVAHTVTSVIEGIISGITDMSQEGQITIKVLMTNTNREELEKILKWRDEKKTARILSSVRSTMG